jgi:aminoglycoside 3-N-acetyltransferase I
MPSKPPVTIRRLTAQDIGLFRDLLCVFGRAFDEPDTYLGAQPSDGYLSDLLNDATFFAVAAIEADAVVGGLAAYALRKFEQERREVYIYDLAVLPSFRRRGIATQLIENLRSLAKEQRAYIVFVQADLEDAPAIGLYSKLGEREEVLHFDFPVE